MEPPVDQLTLLAQSQDNLALGMKADDLADIGMMCVDDYERDKADRSDWETTAREALEAAAQTFPSTLKDTPWHGAANVKWPLLTEAVLQFNARMYPAVIKGDEAVMCKVIGKDAGRPTMAPNPQAGGKPMPVPMMGEDGKPVMGPDGKLQPMWDVQPGAKLKRAERVASYLNTVLFYREHDWESDTDMLLMQLPATGCVFRKRWMVEGMSKSAIVSALKIYVPVGAKSVNTTPRLTEEIHDVYPHEYSEGVRSGRYIEVEDLWGATEKAESTPRMFLEQHRLYDMDEDGFDEPYIVTLDHQTRKVLRIEANFGPDDIKYSAGGKVLSIERGKFYVKYGLFPHPEGKFYDLGLGHLLKQLGAVVDSTINQLLDAGTAQTAGGGFIGSGVRLQTRGGRSVVRFAPGEYKTVDVPGDQLRNAIVERTLPNVSPVTFQVLDMILGAAKGITGAKDVMTGEASNNGQVGTTLALIEQGLQVFNATAKRAFRSLKDEYTLLRDNFRRYATDATRQDYMTVLDDEEADFDADFASEDMDIRPVSDPSSVTRMQKMAKAQFILGTMPYLQAVGGDARDALRRVYEAADVDDIDKLLPAPQPQQPDPKAEAEVAALQARGAKDAAGADKLRAETEQNVGPKGQRDMAAAAKDQIDGILKQFEAQMVKHELEKDALAMGMQFGSAA